MPRNPQPEKTFAETYRELVAQKRRAQEAENTAENDASTKRKAEQDADDALKPAFWAVPTPRPGR